MRLTLGSTVGHTGALLLRGTSEEVSEESILPEVHTAPAVPPFGTNHPGIFLAPEKPKPRGARCPQNGSSTVYSYCSLPFFSIVFFSSVEGGPMLLQESLSSQGRLSIPSQSQRANPSALSKALSH